MKAFLTAPTAIATSSRAPAVQSAAAPPAARSLAASLESLRPGTTADVHALTRSGASWLIHAKNWWPLDAANFEDVWRQHPPEKPTTLMFGKKATFHRFQNTYGVSYKFAGQESVGQPMAGAPAAGRVMRDFASFIDGHNLVAHNAAFDRKFLTAELERVGRRIEGEVVCSMLAARRLFPRAPNHKLGTLVAHLSLPNEGTFHRALADAEMTAHLWSAMVRKLEERGLMHVSFEVMARLCRTSRADVDAFVVRCSG